MQKEQEDFIAERKGYTKLKIKINKELAELKEEKERMQTKRAELLELQTKLEMKEHEFKSRETALVDASTAEQRVLTRERELISFEEELDWREKRLSATKRETEFEYLIYFSMAIVCI